MCAVSPVNLTIRQLTRVKPGVSTARDTELRTNPNAPLHIDTEPQCLIVYFYMKICIEVMSHFEQGGRGGRQQKKGRGREDETILRHF